MFFTMKKYFVFLCNCQREILQTFGIAFRVNPTGKIHILRTLEGINSYPPCKYANLLFKPSIHYLLKESKIYGSKYIIVWNSIWTSRTPPHLSKRISRNQAAAKMIRQYLNLFVNASPVLYIREGAGKICPFFFYFFLNNQDVLLSNCTFE